MGAYLLLLYCANLFSDMCTQTNLIKPPSLFWPEMELLVYFDTNNRCSPSPREMCLVHSTPTFQPPAVRIVNSLIALNQLDLSVVVHDRRFESENFWIIFNFHISSMHSCLMLISWLCHCESGTNHPKHATMNLT